MASFYSPTELTAGAEMTAAELIPSSFPQGGSPPDPATLNEMLARNKFLDGKPVVFRSDGRGEDYYWIHRILGALRIR